MNRFDEFQKAAVAAQRNAKAATIGRDADASGPDSTPKNLFQPFQKSEAMERGEAGSAGGISVEDAEMEMPRFFAQMAEVKETNKRVSAFTEEIEKLHKTALASADSAEQDDCRQKIDVLMAKVNQMTNRTRRILQEIDSINKQLEATAAKGSGNLRMRVDNHRQLSNAFLSAMRRYQKMQETYQDKYKAQLQRQYLIVKPRATQEELAELTRDPDAMKVQVFAITVKEESKKTLAQMKGRLQDMQKLEQSILELNQLFLEMQDLVVSQGDVINKIGYNVDQIEEYTAKAAQDLEQAVESQKAIQKKKWLMLTIIGVVILIVLLVTIGPPLLKFIMEILVLEALTGRKR